MEPRPQNTKEKKKERKKPPRVGQASPLQFIQILPNPTSQLKGGGASGNELDLNKQLESLHQKYSSSRPVSILCMPLPSTLLPLKEKNKLAGTPRWGQQTAFAIPRQATGNLRFPIRSQPWSPCRSARLRRRSANQSRAEIISAAGELDQSKRSVLKRPVRFQDVCAHVTLVADGDFFLCSGLLWYPAEPEDYAGPDSPRSFCSTETGPSHTNRTVQEMSLPHQENQVSKCLHYCVRRGGLKAS